LAALCRRVRNYGNAYALLYHSANVIEARQSNPDLEPAVESVRLISKKLLNCIAFTEPDEITLERRRTKSVDACLKDDSWALQVLAGPFETGMFAAR
jgi:hypothetical protein